MQVYNRNRHNDFGQTFVFGVGHAAFQDNFESAFDPSEIYLKLNTSKLKWLNLIK
jgi:hypothetical protein